MYELEKSFLEIIKEKYKYIARDRNGTLYLYYEKPTLGDGFYYVESGKFLNLSFLKDDTFNNIIFGDEPKLVYSLIQFYKHIEKERKGE